MEYKPREQMTLRIKMYQNGMTLRQIAEKEGVTFQAIHEYLKYHNIPLRDRGGNER